MIDLTTSQPQRQNILNNRFALEAAEEHLALGGVPFEGQVVFTKQQVMAIFDIGDATVERYISQYGDELRTNGYALLKGKNLNNFKGLSDGSLINEGTKTTVLGVFSFRAVLNLAMLLTDSERARAIRSRVLDIVMDVLAQRSGGHTKYINQRDEAYLTAAFQEENYRQKFTNALDLCVEGGQWKYARFTNLIYQSVFQENAEEYRQVLKLAGREKIRNTMYSEVLTVIASYESGIAHELEQTCMSLGRKLTQAEAVALVEKFEKHPLFLPLIMDARTKMASRDLGFRDALHHKLEAYIKSVPESDFERFLGETSKALEQRLSDPETMSVLKRLKDR